jgi:DNA polymerase epsilon subunit 3
LTRKLEFNEIQTDKRNTYRKKVAADKASGAKGGSVTGEGGGRNGAAAEGDGEPAAKKPRIDADADPDGAREEVEDASDLLDEGDLGEDGGEEAEEEGDIDDLEEEDAGEEEVEEPPEDALEENEGRDEGDEALDNGEDSD